MNTPPSDHRLTSMTCVVCKRIPDDSPVYQCVMGHTICLKCADFESEDWPECTICGSKEFKAKYVSPDFLNKLKTNPGTGRPYRYEMEPSLPPSASSSRLSFASSSRLSFASSASSSRPSSASFSRPPSVLSSRPPSVSSSRPPSVSPSRPPSVSSSRPPSASPSQISLKRQVTLEDLFQMPSGEIQEMFRRRAQQKTAKLQSKPRYKPDVQKSSSQLQNLDVKKSCETLVLKASSSSWSVRNSTTSIYSRRPMRCPHQPCNKIVAVSSFGIHFMRDHYDIKRYEMCQGEGFQMKFDPFSLDYSTTYCLGLATLHYKQYQEADAYLKIPVDIIYIMVSGSGDYCLIWLLVEENNSYKCILELDSENGEAIYCACCAVNEALNGYSVDEIYQRMNCLSLSYKTLDTVLEYGPNLKLKIIVI